METRSSYSQIRSFINGEQERYLTTQHERDTETDLDYRGARYYDNEVGRFLSLDPLAAIYPSWSAYNYVLANPIRFIDPNGRSPENADGTEDPKEDENWEDDEYEQGTNQGGWTKNHLLMNAAFGDPAGFNGMIETVIESQTATFQTAFEKLLSDPVGKEYDATQRKKLSTQFSGYSEMKKITDTDSKDKFSLEPGTQAYLGGARSGSMTLSQTKITVTKKVGEKWQKVVVEAVKVQFSEKLGFYDSYEGKYLKLVYIHENIAYAPKSDGTMREAFKLK
jgi:RHS repeat-associated protein